VADTQPDYSGSCMIALYPPPAAAGKLAVADGLDAEGMHVTIAYTGDAADVDRKALKAVAKALASRAPFTATISGHARFTGGDKDVIVALVDSPELETLRSDARKALDAAGIAVPSEHGFTPHLSIQYCGQDDADPVGRLASFPVKFGAVSAVHGKKRTDYPFTDSLAEAARSAYAAGWALSGGPMTDQVRAGCTAAVAHATENRDDPGILEVSPTSGRSPPSGGS
jgi:2'-5' RNA ligase